MDISYNVLTEPWIPAVDQSGKLQNYGILDILEKAHELKEITDASPLVEYGLYRLLCVFLMDALRPEDLEEIEDLLDAGHFDMSQIERYVARCQAEGASFDLFDEKRPFLQTPYHSENGSEEKSIGYLDKHIPTGSNHIHFNHAASEACLSFAEAARLLPSCYIFAVKGGAGYHMSINGRPPYFALVKGGNLFQTLIYTLLPLESIGDFDSIPAFWNRKEPVASKREISRTSWLCGMLFPVRRITLIPKDGRVDKVYFSPGEFLNIADNWIDPHVTYIRTEKGNTALFPEENHPLWMNLNHLISGQGKTAPQIISNYKDTFRTSNQGIRISLYGLQTKDDVASYSDLICRDLRIADSFFSVRGEILIGECIKEAEKLGKSIKKTFEFKKFKPKQKPHGIGHIISLSAENEFYHRCEARLLALCSIERSKEDMDGENVIREWKMELYQMGKAVRDDTLSRIRLTGQQWLELYQKQGELNRDLMELKKEGERADG